LDLGRDAVSTTAMVTFDGVFSALPTLSGASGECVEPPASIARA
jgi:hypothetical protein